MIKANYTFSTLLLVTLAPISLYCSAQVVDISECRDLEDSLARFACYEKLEAGEQSAPVETVQLPTEAAIAEEVQQVTDVSEQEPVLQEGATSIESSSDVDNFGKPSNKARISIGPNGEEELIDTIVALKQQGRNIWLVSLEGGQIWLQMINKPYNMKVGDEVRIYPSGWGSSYRLSVNRISSYIQVKRVK